MNINWEQHYQSEKILNSSGLNISALKWRNDPDESAAFSVLLYLIHNVVLFFVLRKISSTNNKKALDIGTGPAVFRRQFINGGFSYTGMDIAKNIIKRNKRIYNEKEFFVHSVLDNPFPKPLYGLIIANMVLQHIPGPKQFIALSNIHDNLSDNGYVILLEGNKTDKYIGYFARTSKEWITMAEKIGFLKISEISIMCFPFARIIMFLISKICRKMKKINKKWLDFLLWLNLPIELLLIASQFFWPASMRSILKISHSQTLLIFLKRNK